MGYKKVKNYKPEGSKTAQPLSRPQVDFIIQEYEDRNDYRMALICHLLFRVIRIGDVLHTLTIGSIYNPDGTIKDVIHFIEEKTGKKRSIPIRGSGFLRILEKYRENLKLLKMDYPLFFGKKGVPFTPSGVKYSLSQFKNRRGITQVSPYSFRKAGCRFMYDSGARIEATSHVCNHHAPVVTERYICVTPWDVEESMRCLEI